MIIGISGKIGSGKDTVGKIIQYLSTPDHESVTLAEYYAHKWRTDKDKWQIKKFAGKLKECIAIILGIPVEDLEKEEVKNRILGEEWHRFFNWHYKLQTDNNPKGIISKYSATEDEANEDYYLLNESISGHQVKLEALTIRELLQEFGTEVGRSIHPNFWINALFADYKEHLSVGWIPTYSDPDNAGLAPNAEPEYPNWIITDTRFSNEAEAIKSRGGIIIRVNRNRLQPTNDSNIKISLDHIRTNKYIIGVSSHPSETSLDNYAFDYVIDNNGTIEELIEKVKEILIKERIL